MITPQQALQRTIEHREIFFDEMVSLMRQIMRGEVSPVMSAAILAGLRVKKETVEEIAGAASVMRELSEKVSTKFSDQLLDIVGTGGDGAHTFNISTAAMIVASAGGAKVAKHGNRSVSSKSGSADVLEALGVAINLTPAQVGQCIDTIGIGFMFAPTHHSAMKNVAPVRKEMGVKTIFNILGPLTNPANAPFTLMGVFHPDLVGIQLRVLERLRAKRAMIVYGLDGLDEISLGAGTMIGELREGKISEYEIHPEDFNVPMSHSRNLRVNSAQESAQVIRQVFHNEISPAHHVVAINAGAALYLAGLADNIQEAVVQARQIIAQGKAQDKLAQLIAMSQSLSQSSAKK